MSVLGRSEQVEFEFYTKQYLREILLKSSIIFATVVIFVENWPIISFTEHIIHLRF